ncbi:MAG TPA: hypothetical protein DIT15_07820 [Arthrobacter bacterium]|jgi:hypothetical protein|nr:hypothetical protein [Arthrobacter sp.]HAP90542.1 hypothetical protein [Arthrobacter sp.]HBH58426.1 hypothetical protein [Arthrobacter sp.]HCB56981.1 hypothetical protein [Arthrobacter sp.]HCC38703.1 hypothetical protein [Arthrobacter sp.]
MGIIWAASADKHGIDREDALNAILNQIYHVQQFDEPRVDLGTRPDLFIGPTRDRRRMLEVMAVITPPNDILIFHVMEARRKILDIAETETEK